MSADELAQLLAEAVAKGLLSREQADRILALRADLTSGNSESVDFASVDPQVQKLIDLIGPGLLDGTSSDDASSKPPTSVDSVPSLPTDLTSVLAGLPSHLTVTRKLDSGGMGVVYEGYDHEHKRRVAIKVSKPGAGRAWLERRLQQERQLIGALNHPNIVTLYQSGPLASGNIYVLMEFVDGVSLTRWVAANRPHLADRLRLFRKVAGAVGTIHSLGIVHRDLKPSNILVLANGQPKILDFGLAKLLRRRKRRDPTRPGGAGPGSLESLVGVGTRGYRAPEQRDGGRVSRRSDVYALGIILREILTGQTPKEEDALHTAHEASPAPQPPDTPPLRVPAELQAIITKCLSIDPALRYPSATALARDIHRFLNQEPVAAVQHWRPWYRIRKFAERNAVLLAASLAAAGVLFVFVAAQVRARRDATTSAATARHAEAAATEQRELAQEQRDLAQEQTALAEQRTEELERTTGLSRLRAAVDLTQQRRFDEASAQLEQVPPTFRGWEFDHLAQRIQRAPGPRHMLTTHQWMVTAGAISPDGQLVATTGLDGQVLLYDRTANSTQQIRSGSPLPAFPLPPDWQQPLLDRLANHAAVELVWNAGADALLAITADGRLIRWDRATDVWRDEEHLPAPVVAACATPKGELLVVTAAGQLWTCSGDGLPRRAELALGTDVSAIKPSGMSRCLIGHESGVLMFIDLAGNARSAELTLPAAVADIAVHPDGREAWVAVEGEAISRLRVQDNALEVVVADSLRPPHQPSAAIDRIVVTSDGQLLIAADAMAGVTAWDTRSGRLVFARTNERASALRGVSLDDWPRPLRRYTSWLDTTGKACLLGGQNAVVTEWNLTPQSQLTTHRFAPGSVAAVDPTRPERLWIGQPDGSILCRDLSSGHEIANLRSHEGAVTHIIAAADAQRLASSDGQTVKIWNSGPGNLAESIRSLPYAPRVVALALDRSATRLAVCDEEGRVAVLDTTTGATLAQSAEPVVTPRPGSTFMSFNCDGEQLAIAGLPHTLALLDAQTLRRLPEPSFFAGPPTALLFHPTKSDTLIGADSTGRSIVWPEPHQPPHRRDRFQGRPVAAIAATKDGQRLALVSTTGLVTVSDAAHDAGPLFELTDAVAPTDDDAVRSLHFDCRGERLILLRASGTLQVWDNSAGSSTVIQQPGELWKQEVIAHGPKLRGVHVRDESVAIDAKGRILMMFKTFAADQTARHPARVYLAAQAAQWSFHPIYTSPPVDHRGERALERSIALARSGDHCVAAYRRPHSADRVSAGELVLQQVSLADGLSWNTVATTPFDSAPPTSTDDSVVAGPGNLGFDTTLLPARDGATQTSLLHYSGAGRHLLHSQFQNDRWRSQPTGVPGDGFEMVAVQGPDRRVHVAFAPTRFDGDPQPPVYLRLAPDGETTEVREYFDPAIDAYPTGLSLDQQGRPVIVAQHRESRNARVFVSRRDDTGWKQLGLLPKSLAYAALGSHPLCDADGAIHLIVLDTLPQGSLRLFSLIEGEWTCRVIGRLPKYQWRPHDSQVRYRICRPVLRRGPTGQRQVVVGVDDGPRSALLMFREP